MQRYTEAVSKAGDRAITAVGKAQDAYVSAVSSVTKTIGGYIPELPEIPFTSSLPTPKELVSTGFSLAEQALKSQKQYALSFVKALEPVTGKVLPASNGRKTTT